MGLEFPPGGSGGGAGTVTGPLVSTATSIATYADATGTVLLNNPHAQINGTGISFRNDNAAPGNVIDIAMNYPVISVLDNTYTTATLRLAGGQSWDWAAAGNALRVYQNALGAIPFQIDVYTPNNTLGMGLNGVAIGQGTGSTTYLFEVYGDLAVTTIGKGLRVKEGANAKMGTVALNGTTAVVISSTTVTATSRIFLTHQSVSGTPGVAYVSARTAGTSFTILSTSASDLSTVAFLIVEPS